MAKRGKKTKAEPEAKEPVTIEIEAEPKQRGRASKYDAETKVAIIDAAKKAKADGTWADAFKAAEAVGFKSSLPYLIKLVGGKKNANKAKSLGRPKGSKNKVSYKVKPGASGKLRKTGATLQGIGAIVERIAAERVSIAVQSAVASLEAASAELRRL